MAKAEIKFDLKSVGVCGFTSDSKKAPSGVVIAYTDAETGNAVSFTVIDFPLKRLYRREDILAAVAAAEDVKTAVYADSGRPRDIFVCRERAGRVAEIIERTGDESGFVPGFSLIESGNVRFALTDPPALRFGCKLSIKVTASAVKYEKSSWQYAAVNAYNACLLGRVFTKEEFDIETKDKRRVRFAVTSEAPPFVDGTVMLAHPVITGSEGFIDCYMTEKFNYIDGYELSQRAYRLSYTERLREYMIRRE